MCCMHVLEEGALFLDLQTGGGKLITDMPKASAIPPRIGTPQRILRKWGTLTANTQQAHRTTRNTHT